ncbi:hypothetical protein M8494_09040 [Serratia ureilytica]
MTRQPQHLQLLRKTAPKRGVVGKRRCSAVEPEFFAAYSVSTPQQQSDYFLEYQAPFTHPMRYNAEKPTTVRPIHWPRRAGADRQAINGMDNPNQIELYTSGRASNKRRTFISCSAACSLHQQFPDCSNMCHEASVRWAEAEQHRRRQRHHPHR